MNSGRRTDRFRKQSKIRRQNEKDLTYKIKEYEIFFIPLLSFSRNFAGGGTSCVLSVAVSGQSLK